MKKFPLAGLFTETKILLRSIPALFVAVYVVAIVSMNLLANKAVPMPFDYLVLDCGFFLSWMVFLTMDVITRRFGPRAATILSVVALLVNLVMSALFLFCSKLPGMWGESYVDGSETIINNALNNTFGGAWYVVLGSSTAFLTSAIVNNFLNHFLGTIVEKKGRRNFGTYALRSYISTFIGQFVDNLVFALIVSHNFFGLTMGQCLLCALTGAVMELLMEVVFSPIGYRLNLNWEKENVGHEYIDRYLKRSNEAAETEG